MTIILSLGNNNQMIQISDRRLSCNGILEDDESNKSGIVICKNARMTFGYTGLAKWKKFSTMQWLLKALHDSATPDYTIGEILERLKQNATDTFNNHPELKYVDPIYKKLSVMFSGYFNIDGNLKQGCAIISNYHNFKKNTAYPVAQKKFYHNLFFSKKWGRMANDSRTSW